MRPKKIGTRGKQTARLYTSDVLEQLRKHYLKLNFIGASFFNIVINIMYATNILMEKKKNSYNKMWWFFFSLISTHVKR